MKEYIYQQLCDNEILQVCIIIILFCLELLAIYNIIKFFDEITKDNSTT